MGCSSVMLRDGKHFREMEMKILFLITVYCNWQGKLSFLIENTIASKLYYTEIQEKENRQKLKAKVKCIFPEGFCFHSCVQSLETWGST